jgi:hypothetical protein
MKLFVIFIALLLSVSLSAEEGYKTLFDGKSLSGWIKDEHTKDYGWKVQGCCLISASKNNLYTAKEYMDYSVKFTLSLSSAAHNGLGLRVPLSGDPRLGARRAFDVCCSFFQNGTLLQGKARAGKISLPLAFEWEQLFIKELGKK